VLKGVIIAIGCTIAAFFGAGILAAFTRGVGFVVLLGIGVVQALWIVPIWRSFRKMGETETAKGILIMASIVFLLNAGCWGFIASLNLH
jgi:hypothetical protein